MALRRYLFFILAMGFVLLLSAYLFFHDVFSKAANENKLTMSDECTDPSATDAQKVNPNKTLFVSCGGFLE